MTTAFIARLGAVGVAIEADVPELTRLDGIAGDGDLGVTAQQAFTAIQDITDSCEQMSLPDALGLIGRTVASKAPSTFGTLLAFGFLGASKTPLSGSAAEQFAQALSAVGTTIAAKGGATVGDKTMLDALLPAAEAALRAAAQGGDLDAVLSAAVPAAEGGAAATAGMEPKFGRAAWLSERSFGSPDGGARLVCTILRGLSNGSPQAGD